MHPINGTHPNVHACLRHRSLDFRFPCAAASAATSGAASAALVAAGSSGGTPRLPDGPGKYELVGFISHMGSNTACGHYVCHIRKGGQWVLFNDEKVARSENPPLDRGYLYLYRRV